MPSGFGEPLFSSSGAKVDVVFVDGFGSGHSHADEVSSTMAWPQNLLNQTGKTARVFRFEYKARLDDFYPEPSQKGTSIDSHSAELLRGLGGITQSGDRPIILVAHDLGGLLCANALCHQDANPIVVNNIRGLAFFETPFEGKIATRWVAAAGALPALKGLSKPDNLKERSWKLMDINNQFVEFLRTHNEPVQIQCFCKEYASSPLLPQYELVEVTDENLDKISSQLGQWIKDFGTPPAKRGESQAGPGSAVVGDTHYHSGISHNQGTLTGGVAGTSPDTNKISGAHMTYNYGKEYQPKNDNPSPNPGPECGHQRSSVTRDM